MDQPLVISGAEGQLIVSNDGGAMVLWQEEPVVALWPALIEQWPYWFGVIAAAWLLVATLVMALRYRRPREAGQPHCRRCNYQLTGLRRDTCPECGLPLSDGNVVMGIHVRRRLMLASLIGALLLSISYAAMLLAGVPRHGVVGGWLDWHSATVARWARDRQVDWFADWERLGHRVTVVDAATGRTGGLPSRRFVLDSAAQRPMFSVDHQRLYVKRDVDVLELDAATLRGLRRFATASKADANAALMDYPGETLLLVRSGPTLERFQLQGDGGHIATGPMPRGVSRIWSPPGRDGLVVMSSGTGGQRHWWRHDLVPPWIEGRVVPDHLDISRADFTRDGRHVLIPSHRSDYIMRDMLFILDADNAHRVHVMDFGRPVPGFALAESRRWLITWGEDATTGEQGIELLSLRTGELIHAVSLGDEVMIEHAWECTSEPTLLIRGRIDLPHDRRRLLWRYDLTEVLAAHDDAASRW